MSYLFVANGISIRDANASDVYREVGASFGFNRRRFAVLYIEKIIFRGDLRCLRRIDIC